jgi:small subunit ribosomal protein S16
MLAIKLRRIGKKHQAAFRVIVSEKRSKIDGRYVDNIGWLNPKTKEFDVKKEKAEYWIKNGAVPTDTVHNLFVKAGVLEGPKISVHKKKKGGAEEPAKIEVSAEKPAEAVAEEKKEEVKEEAKEEIQEAPESENK